MTTAIPSPTASIDSRNGGAGDAEVDDEHRLVAHLLGQGLQPGVRQRQVERELEERLIELLDLPLNLDGNSRNAFHPELTRVRRDAVASANALPVVPNPGVGGR